MNKNSSLWQRLKTAAADVLDFQSRVWVVNIRSSTFQDESFVVSEDSFNQPLQWMKKKQFDAEMLEKVEAMKVSQVLVFHIEDVRYRLLRVK
ncbi:hypothetical protein C9J03_05510 [Photobacterium gaetbulicola]|uniref:Uncharacterized protein n=1 Tax=Photobacterium gaetbulicola Gung47 TaxID=658445 RepID=A0A0C5WNX5_9GAMM|nr:MULTISPECIES: hypothetical protein [Photobacterium]AJR08818.1 hypothetical protein H744_2c2154 [Photobacterium gaetbulicola Gung47]PSU13386.1 hypothetical protein C9J03_05510 [Photobacterium gaetbulicola]WEM40938.1 hypothetical protein PTW35_09795 [Photobacterium sp. DA100]